MIIPEHPVAIAPQWIPRYNLRYRYQCPGDEIWNLAPWSLTSNPAICCQPSPTKISTAKLSIVRTCGHPKAVVEPTWVLSNSQCR